MRPVHIALLLALLALPADARDQHAVIGIASWYGPYFHGRRMADGHPFDMFALTAASRVLPLGSYVEVTNLDNGRRVRLRITDRGPYIGHRLIDLSYGAAKRLDMVNEGLAPVSVRPLL